MLVPRKKHPSGNKYNSIADGVQGRPVLWCIKLQDSKDPPMDQNNNPRFLMEFENHTRTPYMTKPIQNTDEVVTMIPGFVLLLALHHAGVYEQALIKKQRHYWPEMFLGMKLRST
ncbi:LOW QUALITY PROTEIN: hypothetical protein ACHAXS_003570 [Conticribra weissflogii]